MKKLIYSFKILAVFIFCSLFFACEKESTSLNVQEEFEFTIGVSYLKTSDGFKEASTNTLSDADKIILTIQNSDGTSTKYVSKEVKIFEMNGSYYTQKLALKKGNYILTEFNILDSVNGTIFTVPQSGSTLAQNVSAPLPILFEVSKNVSSPISVEVLSTEGKAPEDFGLSHFPIIEIKTFSFLIGVAAKETDKILDAKVTITNGSYTFVQYLDSIVNNVVTIKDGLDYYILTVENEGYDTYIHTYPYDSLLIHANSDDNLPLIIELDKEPFLFSDDFSNGANPLWTFIGEGWSFSNGMAYSSFPTTYTEGRMILLNSTWTNYTFEVDLMGLAGPDKGIGFRVKDNDNYYYTHLIGPDGGYSHLMIGKVIEGSPTYLYLNTAYSVLNNINYHLKIVVEGSSIKLSINDVLIIDVVDNEISSGGISLNGGAGGYAPNIVKFDNVLVY